MDDNLSVLPIGGSHIIVEDEKKTGTDKDGYKMVQEKPSAKDWEELNTVIKGKHIGDVKAWFKSRGLDSTARQFWTILSEWPLLTAVKTGHIEILGVLVEYGFDPHETRYYGDGLVHAAASHGHVTMLERLCQLGLHVLMQDDEYNTPLHLAAKTTNDNSRMIKCLVRKGADPNAKNDLGETPLHLASGKGSLENVIALTEAGSKVNERTYHGVSPLYCAITRKYDVEEHARILFDMGATSGYCRGRYCEFRAACSSSNLPVIKLLVERNFCMSCKFSMMKYTPLYNLVATMTPELRDKAIDVIVDGGYDIASETNWITHKMLYPVTVKDIDALHRKLIQYAMNPRSLRHLSAIAIRRCFSGRLPSDLSCLPLPDVLKDVISLKHSFG